MPLRLTTIFLLASVAAAHAQHQPHQNQPQKTGGTPASQMADRAHANSDVLDATSGGTVGIYEAPDASQKPSGAQPLIRRPLLNGTPSDALLHYPYGRYAPTLGNVDPNSMANPLARNAPAALPPPGSFRPPALGSQPAFSRGR